MYPRYRRHRPSRVAIASGLLATLMLVCGVALPAAAQNNWQKEIDFDLLKADEGTNLATGAGLSVTQVETFMGGHYLPSTTGPDVAGKTFTVRSGTTGGTSSHATTVGRYFYARDNFTQVSVAPQISNVDLYSATSWLTGGYLTADTNLNPPPVSPNRSRVASHAYLPGTNTSQTERVDYLVDTDDFIQVTAGANATVTGIATSFNSIAVGHVNPALNGPNGTDPALFGYPAGRHKPDLVATHGTSDAIGIISGSAGLLIDLGSRAALSDGSYVSPRTGTTIRHAQTSETVKAALMAGANRVVTADEDLWSGVPITDYRTAAGNRTANGLDTRFGAGRLNINQSYKIIQGGEQASLEDAPLTAGAVAAYGFDYDPTFGGADASNTTASYRFGTVAEGGTLTTTLAWNVPIVFDSNFALNATPDFNRIELLLFDLTAGTPALVANSSSAIDNTQSLWQDLAGDSQYLLQVRAIDGQSPFDQDYSLAWRVDGWAPALDVAVPEPTAAACLLLGAVALLGRRRGR